jgi:hypothetical protein
VSPDERDQSVSHAHPNQPIPLEVDDRLYATWSGVVDDVRDLMAGKRGLGLHELAGLISPELVGHMPDA